MVGKTMGKQRTELVERSFEHTLDRSGGMRRVWLRGRENIQIKTGHGTPRGWASAWLALIWPNQPPSIAYLAVVMGGEGRCCGIMPIAVICGGE